MLDCSISVKVSLSIVECYFVYDFSLKMLYIAYMMIEDFYLLIVQDQQ